MYPRRGKAESFLRLDLYMGEILGTDGTERRKKIGETENHSPGG